MERIYDNIYMKRFLYFNCYIIKGKDGDILIDTGFIGIKRRLKNWLDKFNIKLIILTHAHVDHIWNVAYLKRLYNCKVAISSLDVENLDNSVIKSVPVNWRYKYRTKLMNWGMKKFIPELFEIDYFLNDNEMIDICGIKLKIISLPGHTKGSIGILYKNNLFAGDALVNRKLYVEIAYQNQNNEDAKKSAQKISKIDFKYIYVGHENRIKYSKLQKSMNRINNQ